MMAVEVRLNTVCIIAISAPLMLVAVKLNPIIASRT